MRDEASRRTWLILLSAGSMLIVVGLWIQYVRTFVVVENTVRVAAETSRAPRFTAVMSAGIGVLSEKGKGLADALRARFTREREIVIENPRGDFVIEELDPGTGTFPQP